MTRERAQRIDVPTPAIGAGWAALVFFALCTAWLRRIDAHVRLFQVAYLLGFLGFAWLLWVVIRTPQASKLGRWRWWLIGCFALRALTLAAAPVDDAHRYVWEGRVQWAGLNPYLHPPTDGQLVPLRDQNWSKINHPDFPAIYAPVAQMEFFLVAAVKPSVYTVKLLHVLWDGLVVLVLGACLKRLGYRPHLAIAYGLCPLTLTAFAIEGHVDSLMLLFVALTVWCDIARRTKLAGVMLGLAIATKIVPVVLLPWFVLRQRRSALIALAVCVLCYLPYLSAGTTLFSSLFRFATMSEFFSFPGTFHLTEFATPFSRVAVMLIAGVLLVLLAQRRLAFVDFASSAGAVLLLLMPIIHYWYLTWVLIFVPLNRQLRWLVAALAMVVYFEADRQRAMTGAWIMPHWAPIVVWLSFLLTWLGESVVGHSNKTEPRG